MTFEIKNFLLSIPKAYQIRTDFTARLMRIIYSILARMATRIEMEHH